MSVIEDAKSWMKQHPNRINLVDNIEVSLSIYASCHPEKNINSDFILQKSQIHVGSQIFEPHYDEHFFTFTLEKGLANYNGKKLGWSGDYVGLNQEGLILCITSGYNLRVIDSEQVYPFTNSMLKLVHEKKWYLRYGNKPKLYALPVQFPAMHGSTLDDF